MRELDYYIAIGYKVINNMPGLNSLSHHGIKGQKHGVRHGPPYPLKKDMHDSIVGKDVVEDALKSGKVSKKINKDNQKPHNLNTHTNGRSYLSGDSDYAQELVNKLCGSGTPVLDRKDNWTHKEKVSNDNYLGVYVNPDTGKEEKTKDAMIVYSRTGSHIYPRKGGRK